MEILLLVVVVLLLWYLYRPKLVLDIEDIQFLFELRLDVRAHHNILHGVLGELIHA